MKKLLSVLACLMLTCCTATTYDDNKVVAGQFTGQTVVKKIVPESAEAEEYLVRVDFVLFSHEIVKHPLKVKKFMEAVSIWTDALPISVSVYIENTGFFPWMNVGPNLPQSIPNAIYVRFVDISDYSWYAPGLIGAWRWTENSIYLEAETDFPNEDVFKALALHELGHVLGLPHVVNIGGVTGDIMIDFESIANTYIMYPRLSSMNAKAEPSEIEVSIAKRYILNMMLSIGVGSERDYFCLTDEPE
jgi:hypothetical protein